MERDEQTGKPIYKVKDIQAEMKNLIDVHSTMVELENQVKKQITESLLFVEELLKDILLTFNYGN